MLREGSGILRRILLRIHNLLSLDSVGDGVLIYHGSYVLLGQHIAIDSLLTALQAVYGVGIGQALSD